MPETAGTPTKSTFLNEVDGNELHLEFEVAASTTVYPGQPVAMNSTGKVVPVTAASHDLNCIGIAMQQRTAGQLVTVATRGVCLIQAEAKTDMSPGPVLYDAYNATSGLLSFDDTSVTVANQAGWSLDTAAAAEDEIRVLIKK